MTISTVTTGVFDDFLPLRARVTPLVTVYLDAVEGGRVDELFVEDGATVVKGQLLARLSNADLQLSTLARQTEVEQQINNMRSQELALAQTRLANERAMIEADLERRKAQRAVRDAAAACRQGLRLGQGRSATPPTTSPTSSAAPKSCAAAVATDERLQSSQLAQLRASAASLQKSLGIARSSLDALNLRAPVSGPLTRLLDPARPVAAEGRAARPDRLARPQQARRRDRRILSVAGGRRASRRRSSRAARPIALKVAQDLSAGARRPVRGRPRSSSAPSRAGIQRGQTLQAKLTLGDAQKARLIPYGSFYNDTGGSWVFVVSPDGKSATRRDVQLGRKNPDFIEVLSGLEPGEKVLTSPYAGFADKHRLDLDRPAN